MTCFRGDKSLFVLCWFALSSFEFLSDVVIVVVVVIVWNYTYTHTPPFNMGKNNTGILVMFGMLAGVGVFFYYQMTADDRKKQKKEDELEEKKEAEEAQKQVNKAKYDVENKVAEQKQTEERKKTVMFKRAANLDSTWMGAGGGSLQPELLCPAGTWMTKIKGRAGTYLDGIGIGCSDGTNTTVYGGGGGSAFEINSAVGFDRLDVGSGKYIDGVSAFYKDNNIGKAGGSGGSISSFLCKGGKLMGLGVKSGKYVDGIRLLCGEEYTE